MKLQPTTLHFLISATVTDHGQFDSDTMRSGLREGIGIAKRECMLTKLDDETTELGAISLSSVGDAVEAVKLILGDSIEQSPEATAAIASALQQIQLNLASNRQKILTAGERELLLSGIGWSKKAELDASEMPSTAAWAHLSDEALIEVAFISAAAMDHYPDAEYEEAVKLLAAKPEILKLLLEVDGLGAEPIIDHIEEWARSGGALEGSEELRAVLTICANWERLMDPSEGSNTEAPGARP